MRAGHSIEKRPMDKKSCEVWTGTKWEILPVSAVHPHRDTAVVRCHECHGPVLLMKRSSDGRNEAHYEHRPSHTGCSLAHRIYSGVQSLHPLAVVPPGQASDVTFTDHITEEAAEEIIGPVGETEKERLLLARVGQGWFRAQLLKRWQTCGVLGCGPDSILVASHIVAWRSCANNAERLDPNNGLLLSPNLDKLFDRKLISFSDSGKLLLSSKLDKADAQKLGLRADMKLVGVAKGALKYLQRHRGDSTWHELTA